MHRNVFFFAKKKKKSLKLKGKKYEIILNEEARLLSAHSGFRLDETRSAVFSLTLAI